MQHPPLLMNNLFYGNDTTKLLEKETLLKKEGFTFFKGDKLSLYNEYHSENLFGSSSKLIVESEIVSLTDIAEIINKKGNSEIAYFLYETNIKSSLLKLFDKTTSYKIADDKAIFTFLDKLFSSDLRSCLKFLKKFEKDEDKIFLISMIFYNLKNLALFYYDKVAFYKLNPYVGKKVEILAHKISAENLKKIIYIVSEADFKIKTSSDKESVLISTILYIANS